MSSMWKVYINLNYISVTKLYNKYNLSFFQTVQSMLNQTKICNHIDVMSISEVINTH